MQTNLWIARSQRFYRWLLRLYPQAYQETYEAEMFRMFTSQCLDAYKQSGRTGILSLWPRTLLDLGITVLHEHFVDPRARLGLLEADPNAPLPWKGVLLILIPGLIFFVSQIVQLTSTTLDWFYWSHYRAAYYLIVPVVLVWLLTRRFPVWGLMPFGLLFATLRNYSQRVPVSSLPIVSDLLSAKALDGIRTFITITDGKYLVLTTVSVFVVGGLIWFNMHRRQISRAAWGWLGLYFFLILFQMAAQVYQLITWQGIDLVTAFNSSDVKYYLVDSLLWYLYESLSFLLLIFIGLFFARKYGGFSFLLLLGYLLPTIVFGRYDEKWNAPLPFYWIGIGVVVYRFIVAFVAPIWLARSASEPKRQRATAIPVAIAIASQLSLTIITYAVMTTQTGYLPTPLDFALRIWDQLLIAAGLGLAIALYQPKEGALPSSPTLVVVSN